MERFAKFNAEGIIGAAEAFGDLRVSTKVTTLERVN
jgi:hypothetical protein